MTRSALPLAASLLLLPGCVAGTATSAAAAPVNVTGNAVDTATTSRAEADRNRGRDLRKREKRLHKLQRDYAKRLDHCQRLGESRACNDAAGIQTEIEALSRTVPTANY